MSGQRPNRTSLPPTPGQAELFGPAAADAPLGTPDRVRPVFSGSRLRLARELGSLTQRDVARSLGITPAAVSQYESGTTRPTLAVIEALAQVLRVPCGFFADGRGQHRANAFFRSLRSLPARERHRATAQIVILGDFVTALDRHLRLPEVALPDVEVRDYSPAEAERAAGLIREAWQLPAGPVVNVVRCLERHGVVVVRLDETPVQIDAFSVHLQTRPVVVLTTTKADAARSRFDAAHELGHLVLHSAAVGEAAKMEAQADAFAASFLMPADDIRDVLPANLDWHAWFRLKGEWRVSLAALVRRGRDLGSLTADQYANAMRQMTSRGWRQREPIDLGPPERPMFLARSTELLDELGLSVRDIAEEASLPTSVITQFLDTARDPRPVLTL